MILGKCNILYGKETRNLFTWMESRKTIHIDFDSDFSLYLTIPLKNPEKALRKAQKIVDYLKDRTIMVEELEKLGFEHDIPRKYYDKD